MSTQLQELSQQFETRFRQLVPFEQEPRNLYEPCAYLLQLGGKRIRPVLCLMAAQAFDADQEDAYHIAAAIELFHNFTLIHDDIMDKAPLRRGFETVHAKYGLATGILSGDVMFIYAYELLIKSKQQPLGLLALFNKTAIEVCEGQQWDMDFEQRADVSIDAYLEMIRLKTSVLLAASLQMGAMAGKASKEQAAAFYNFGIQLGLAFQLQDDYLDAFGEVAKLGKQKGGDIQANKKTYLLLKALELANEEQKNQIEALLQSTAEDKVAQMLSLFEATKAKDACKTLMQHYTQAAFDSLESLSIAPHKKEPFIQVTNYLLNREH
jgi:geranylgeranyl diphosphate synthase type II